VRVVIDTNVLVSALLKPGSVPARALEAVFDDPHGEILYDARIAEEYRTVLERPKFRAIARPAIAALLERLAARGTHLPEATRWTGAIRDDDDRIFVEVALAGRADAIVTGNIADYPLDLGFEVLPPATVLARLEGARARY
jgi:uncharacterized protein